MPLDDFPLFRTADDPHDDDRRARLERLARLKAAIARLQETPRSADPDPLTASLPPSSGRRSD